MNKHNEYLCHVLKYVECEVVDSPRGALAYISNENGRESEPFASLETRASKIILRMEGDNNSYDRAVVGNLDNASVQKAYDSIMNGSPQSMHDIANDYSQSLSDLKYSLVEQMVKVELKEINYEEFKQALFKFDPKMEEGFYDHLIQERMEQDQNLQTRSPGM